MLPLSRIAPRFISNFKSIRKMSSQSPCICIFYATVEGQTEKIATHMKELIDKKNKYQVQMQNISNIKDSKLKDCKVSSFLISINFV